jgi:hypothetical protein
MKGSDHEECHLLGCYTVWLLYEATFQRNLLPIVFLHSVLQLLVTANAVPSSLILVSLMKEAIRSSETLVLTTATWYNIPEDGILHKYISSLFLKAP